MCTPVPGMGRKVVVEFTAEEARGLLPLLAQIQAFRRKLVNEVALLDKADEKSIWEMVSKGRYRRSDRMPPY